MMEKRMHHASKEVMALTKCQGGLNLLDLKTWNKAAYCGLIFKIVSHDEGLWVKWVWEHNIQNKGFWSMKVPSECSWAWKNILNMRDIAKKFIKYIISNGEMTSFWFDPWCNGEVLWDNSAARVLFQLPPGTKVVELIDNGKWGGVVRDDNSNVLLAYMGAGKERSVLVQELKAILVGLRGCRILGKTKVLVAADSLLAVQILQNKLKPPWYCSNLVGEIKHHQA
ncbi:hypothetical protein FRX31_011851, partial [Thalictrum thalictroides]